MRCVRVIKVICKLQQACSDFLPSSPRRLSLMLHKHYGIATIKFINTKIIKPKLSDLKDVYLKVLFPHLTRMQQLLVRSFTPFCHKKMFLHHILILLK